jgi:hypothetical protein
MSSSWRRYEVLLPIQFNDGRDVPPEWLAEAVLEIVDHFGAASYETQKVEGHWRQGGVLYRDDLVKIVVDVADTPENRRIGNGSGTSTNDGRPVWSNWSCGLSVTRLTSRTNPPLLRRKIHSAVYHNAGVH